MHATTIGQNTTVNSSLVNPTSLPSPLWTGSSIRESPALGEDGVSEKKKERGHGVLYLGESKDYDRRRGFGRQMRKEKKEKETRPICLLALLGMMIWKMFRDTMQMRFDPSYLIKHHVYSRYLYGVQ